MKLTPPIDVYKDAVEAFLQYCHKRKYPAKAHVIRPGDAGDRLYYIIEGSVSICMFDREGDQELILAYLNKGQFIGEIGIFKALESRKVSVKSRTQCFLAEIGYDRFRQLLKKELLEYTPDLMFMIGSQLSDRLLKTNRNFSNLAFLDVENRITSTLHDLCKEPDAMTHPDGHQLHITRQEIGRLVGCSREMAGRVLKDLQEKKMISAHGKTIVVFGTR